MQTTEEQIYELFSRVGTVKRIIMGLDRNQKTPCGFCFVESAPPPPPPPSSAKELTPDVLRFFQHDQALSSLRYISGTKLDERIVRADLDPGFLDGRQYGRGKSGGQVRDEYREDFDSGRGTRVKAAGGGGGQVEVRLANCALWRLNRWMGALEDEARDGGGKAEGAGRSLSRRSRGGPRRRCAERNGRRWGRGQSLLPGVPFPLASAY